MWRFDLAGLLLSLANVLISIILILGIYLIVFFFWKMISYGTGQSKYKEAFIGIFLIGLGVFLKMIFIW